MVANNSMGTDNVELEEFNVLLQDTTYVEVSAVLLDDNNNKVGRVSFAGHRPSMFMTIFLGTFLSSVISVSISLLGIFFVLAVLRSRWRRKWKRLKKWMADRSREMKRFVVRQKAQTQIEREEYFDPSNPNQRGRMNIYRN